MLVKYKNIISFCQMNNFDSNNELLDKIKNCIYEDQILIRSNNYKYKNVNYNSTGFIIGLFKIFNNIKNFCIVEKKYIKCFLCNKESSGIVKPFYQFLQITEEK